MKKLRVLSKVFQYTAFVTLAVTLYIFLGSDHSGINVFRENDQRMIIAYILLMIPAIFGCMSVSLRVVAKALEK